MALTLGSTTGGGEWSGEQGIWNSELKVCSHHNNTISYRTTSLVTDLLNYMHMTEASALPFSSHDSIRWLDFPNWCIDGCTSGALSRRIRCTYGAHVIRDLVIELSQGEM